MLYLTMIKFQFKTNQVHTAQKFYANRIHQLNHLNIKFKILIILRYLL